MRQVLADLTIAQRENETLRYELRQVTKKRDYARRREAECVDLLADRKQLTRDVRILQSFSAAAAKKRLVVERALLTKHGSEIGQMREMLDLQASEQVRVLKSSEARVSVAEAEAANAAEREQAARDAEMAALATAEEAATDLAEASAQTSDAQWELKLAEKREARLRRKLSDISSAGTFTKTGELSADERLALSRDALHQRDSRERAAIRNFLALRKYQPRNLCVVLKEHDLLNSIIFKTQEGFDLYFDATQALFARVEKEHYGPAFAFHLHYQHHMTMKEILELTQAGCKKYNANSDHYESKIALYHPFRKGKVVKVPRLAPPASQLLPLKKTIEEESKVSHDENGRIARRQLETIYTDLLTYGPGKFGMPTLDELDGSDIEVPFVNSWDATGHGKLQISTAVVRNPYAPHSGQQLHIVAVGNCDDGRSGAERLLGKDNIFLLNHWSRDQPVVESHVRDRRVRTRPHPYFSTDVSSLRHCEHVAQSGWCGCSRDFSLRTTPDKPDDLAVMYTLLGKCVSPTAVDRFVKSHSIVPGETKPRPCPCCDFGHSDDVMAEYEALLAEEKVFQSDRSKAGKSRYSRWRMKHALNHDNIQPGEFGRPQIEYDMDDFILDLLHLAKLGVPKTPWKHGILNNCSDDAREEIEEMMKTYKHQIDCKRKDANRVGADKWFTGEAWSSLCAGTRGSPGGPVVIAKCVKIFADDMQKRGVTIGAGTAEEEAAAVAAVAATTAAKKPTGKAGKAGKLAALAGQVATPVATPVSPEQTIFQAKLASLQHEPTVMEKAANQEHLKVIREIYGSRAQTIINTLLAFDAYFAWYYPLKDLKDTAPFGLSKQDSEQAAFANCCAAIDMHEIMERVSIRNHKSFLFHGAVYKVTRDILKISNPWAFGIQALELQNAETKRVAKNNGARNLEFHQSSQTRVALKHGQVGPMRLTPLDKTKTGTTMAISTINFLLSKRRLRRGDGLLQIPESRQSDRVFGEDGRGRSSLASAGMKLELLGSVMTPPRSDTCVAAMVREIAAAALDL